MADKLSTALTFTLKFEGGFSNHPNDLGGPTNKGIIQKVYDAFRTRKGLPKQTVKLITDAEVHEIYRTGYWGPSRAEEMELPLAVVQFDTAVNFGPGGAAKFLQRALGVTADGDIGPQTMGALKKSDQAAVAQRYCDLRIARRHARVAEAPSQKVFLKGWLNRDNALKSFAKSLAPSDRGLLEDEAGGTDPWDLPVVASREELEERAAEAGAAEDAEVSLTLRGEAAAQYAAARRLLQTAFGISAEDVDARVLESGLLAGLERLAGLRSAEEGGVEARLEAELAEINQLLEKINAALENADPDDPDTNTRNAGRKRTLEERRQEIESELAELRAS